MSDPFTDRDRLVTSAYATPDQLNARRSIYAYRVPPLDLVAFAEDLVNWRGDERLLDVGCGPGQYVSGIRAKHSGVRATLVDVSPGMVATAKGVTGAPGLIADVTGLPFDTGTFDLTLAMHMLYHVPDIPTAVAELRRVTSRSGMALVSTNSDQHLRELRALLSEATSSMLGRPITMSSPLTDRFSLENGADILSRAFADVRRKAAWGALAISDAAPVVDYIRSIRTLVPQEIAGEDERWESIVSFVEARVNAIIAERGSIELSARQGVFVCR